MEDYQGLLARSPAARWLTRMGLPDIISDRSIFVNKEQNPDTQIYLSYISAFWWSKYYWIDYFESTIKTENYIERKIFFLIKKWKDKKKNIHRTPDLEPYIWGWIYDENLSNVAWQASVKRERSGKVSVGPGERWCGEGGLSPLDDVSEIADQIRGGEGDLLIQNHNSGLPPLELLE